MTEAKKVERYSEDTLRIDVANGHMRPWIADKFRALHAEIDSQQAKIDALVNVVKAQGQFSATKDNHDELIAALEKAHSLGLLNDGA